MGWDFNAAYVRGQNSYYTGYEYDGIPVNRVLRQLQLVDGVQPGLAGAAGLHRRRPVLGCHGRHGRVHQPGHQDRYVPGLWPRQSRASRRPRSTIKHRSRSADRRRIGPSATTSGSRATTKTYRVLDNNNGAGYMTPGGHSSGPTERQRDRLRLRQQPGAVRRPTCVIGTCQGVKPICPLASPRRISKFGLPTPRLLAVLQRPSAPTRRMIAIARA